MPRDLPLDVSFSQVALCIIHTTKYYYLWSPTQKWKKWRRSTMPFFTLGSTTLFMSHSFR